MTRTPVPIERWHEPRSDDDDDYPWGEWTRRWGMRPRALGWRRRPLPRWSCWRALQLDRSTRKRRATWVQPEPRWRHADGRAAEAAKFEHTLAALRLARACAASG